MKQIFVLFVLLSMAALTGLQAQSYAETAAAKAAATDARIVKKVDRITGEVNYLKKKACPITGAVTYEPVEYCKNSKKFVNVPPKKSSCSKSKSLAEVHETRAVMASQRYLSDAAAKRAASVVANKKMQTAKATFVRNKSIKP